MYMIKNNESRVEITNRNIKYYTGLNYLCSVGDIISIDVSKMPRMSHNIVIAICELCGVENNLMFSKYNKNKNKQGYYSCFKCSIEKRKKTCLDLYGVEYISQTDKNRERMSKFMASEEFKSKSRETMLNKYGCLYSQTEEHTSFISNFNKDRIRKLKEDGTYDCPLSWCGNKDIREKAMFEKYGATYSFNIPDIKEKIQNNNLAKFGHVSPFGNLEIQNSAKISLINKYGVDNPFKNKIIQEKIKKIAKDKYNDIDIELFLNYKKKIKFLTNNLKTILFDKWDGCDYYDGEYIKDNFKFGSNSSKYPTIDHKISCYYGFKNKILAEDISNINNLCITKRNINCIKNRLTEEEFIKIFR